MKESLPSPVELTGTGTQENNKKNTDMEKTFAIAQLIIAALMFLCVTAGAAAHILTGHAASIPGLLVSLVFIILSWKMLRISYEELRGTR